MGITKKIIVLLSVMLVTFGATFSAPPEWVMTTPQHRDFYYFSGSFTGDDKAKANNSARAEVVGAILFMINSTVSASTSFDQVYTRNSRRGDSNDSRLFKKIKTRGTATVSKLEFVKTEFEKTNTGKWTAYVLARIPKKEVDASIRQFHEMKERLKKLKTACVIIAQYPDGEIAEVDVLKNIIEKFYRETLGYNIVEAEINYSNLKGVSVSGLTHRLKQMLDGYDQLIVGVVSLQERPTSRTTRIGDTEMTTISAAGTLILRTIELASMKVVENNDYSGRGVSTRGERAAMDELIKEFRKQLEGDDSSAGGRDSVFD